MTEALSKQKNLIYGITLVTALVVLVDFVLPAKVFTEDVVGVEKNKQQYYNAARNHHYSYKVVTTKHSFLVSEDFAKTAKNKKVTYSVSLIFKEINKYGLFLSKKYEFYSFRIASGLVLPVIVIFTIMMACIYKKRISVLIFVLQVVLLIDVIALIL